MTDAGGQPPPDPGDLSVIDTDEESTTDADEESADPEDDSGAVEEQNKRFVQAVSYFIEWAKHLVTLGSGLMVLSVALLKDVVKTPHAPISFLIAGLLVLSYLSMLGAIWLALRFVRFAAGCLLTNAPQIAPSNKLAILKDRLNGVQNLFLVSLVFFAALALCVLLAWAFGRAG